MVKTKVLLMEQEMELKKVLMKEHLLVLKWVSLLVPMKEQLMVNKKVLLMVKMMELKKVLLLEIMMELLLEQWKVQ